MAKYKVTCIPNVEEYECEVEADSVEDAIKQAEDEAKQNCYFMATDDDVEEIEE